VDGTLIPSRDRALAVPSKDYRHSVKPAVGHRRFDPAGHIDRHLVGRPVMADGGYIGTGLIMPYRLGRDGRRLPGWQERLNAEHRCVAPESNTPPPA